MVFNVPVKHGLSLIQSGGCIFANAKIPTTFPKEYSRWAIRYHTLCNSIAHITMIVEF